MGVSGLPLVLSLLHEVEEESGQGFEDESGCHPASSVFVENGYARHAGGGWMESTSREITSMR